MISKLIIFNSDSYIQEWIGKKIHAKPKGEEKKYGYGMHWNLTKYFFQS